MTTTTKPNQPAAEPGSGPARRRRRLARVVLLVVSLGTALLAGEFAARWQIEGSFLEAVDSILGLRTAAEPGGDANLVEDALLGFKLNPALPGVNSRGVRHAEFEASKPAGRFRVFLIGDSVGFPLDGFFHDVETSCRARSRHDLEFVNACVHGYTTYQERLFLERDLLPLAPDLVVLQYCVNDNFRFLHRLTSKGRRLVTPEAKNFLFPEGDGFWPWLTRSSYLVYSIRKLMLSSQAAEERAWQGIGRAAWTDATWPDEEEQVLSMRDSLRTIGARLVVLAVPHEDQLDADELARDAAFVLKPQRMLGEICARLSVPFVDVQPDLLPHRGEGLYLDRLHLSPSGHRLVGQRLAAFLDERHLVPID
ncbi:MAG TPA: SGNH/GDSL hydrolase family protein [Planctomycetota bacterium]|nr:SGNH/GDSL hydrolase family protein [Planctomycetota bacterium]